MKYVLILVLAFAIFSNCFAQEKTKRKKLTYYEQKKSIFELLPNDKDEIIFLGNSITEGCEWNELFGDNWIKNRGISADVAEGVLLRLDEVTESKPLKIFLMIGINDLAFGYADKEILDNYNAIINKIKTDSKETEIYIQSVLPINKDFGEFKGYMHLAEKIIQLNTALENIAKENNTTYINLYDSFILNNQMNPE